MTEQGAGSSVVGFGGSRNATKEIAREGDRDASTVPDQRCGSDKTAIRAFCNRPRSVSEKGSPRSVGPRASVIERFSPKCVPVASGTSRKVS